MLPNLMHVRIALTIAAASFFEVREKDIAESVLKRPKIDNPNKSLSLPLETQKVS